MVLTFGELCSLFTILTFHYSLQSMLEMCSLSHIRASDSNLSLRAARRLLSVLGDAEMHLGPKLEFIKPSHKTAHFLGVDLALLDRLSFDQFVAPQEQERLQAFLAEDVNKQHLEHFSGGGSDALHEAGVEAQELPRCISTKLATATGRTWEVYLYHTHLPSPAEHEACGHLVCFRDVDQLMELDRPVSTIDLGGTMHRKEETVSPSRLRAENPSDENKRWKDIQAKSLEEQRLQNAAELSEESASSRTSQKLASWLDPDSLGGVSLTFDAFGRKHEIQELTLKFKTPKPKLLDWVHPEIKASFRKWIETSLHDSIQDLETKEFDAKPMLTLPFLPRNLISIAEDVELYLEEPDAEDNVSPSKMWGCVEFYAISTCSSFRSRGLADSPTKSPEESSGNPSKLQSISEIRNKSFKFKDQPMTDTGSPTDHAMKTRTQ